MADIAASTKSPSTPGTNMDTNTAELAAPQPPLSTQTSNRVKIVCLSGPIKIIVPLSPQEEMETLERERRNLLLSDARASTELVANTIDNNISRTVQLSQPTDIRVPIHAMGDITHMDSASNMQPTKCPSPSTGKSATTVKKPNHDHPEANLSPL
jgi:hypothetical protein